VASNCLWNPANPGNALVVKETLHAAAQALGVQLQLQEAQDPKNLDSAFSAMTKAQRWRRRCVGRPDVF
jgi:hypothetical protein